MKKGADGSLYKSCGATEISTDLGQDCFLPCCLKLALLRCRRCLPELPVMRTESRHISPNNARDLPFRCWPKADLPVSIFTAGNLPRAPNLFQGW